jgi:CRISPR system Cascade subunit CasA
MAEGAARRLSWATQDASARLAGGGRGGGASSTTWSRAAKARFWPQAEALFWQLSEQRAWSQSERQFTALAVAVYDEVTDQALSHPRSAKAVIQARRRLFPARRGTPSRKDAA